MDGLVDKIVEKYSEDLFRVFPLQKIFSTIFVVLILYMVKHGKYISALESMFQLSLNDLFKSDGGLLEITLGLLASALVLITFASFIQKKVAVKISRFVAKGSDLVGLSQILHRESASVELPTHIVAALSLECSDKLERRRNNLARLSSLAEMLFILAFAEVLAAVYGFNLIDLSFAMPIFLIWLAIRVWLIFRFIGEILPLEAHISGIKGVPYELDLENRIE